MAERSGRWTGMSPHQLLDLAQAAFEEVERTQPNANGLYQPLIRAQALVAAAQVQALAEVSWTLEYRVTPTIGAPRG